MADKVQLEVEVEGVEKSINSVKELKNALKAAKDEQLKAAAAFGEGSKEYVTASKNVSKLADKMGDLKDSTKSLEGSGIERASAGFSQLGEGLRNLDFDKVKTGLTAVKSALAATGVMLIVMAVSYLIENFDSLSKGSGLLAKSLRVVGEVIQWGIDKIYEFTDALGLTNSALDKMADALVTNAEKAKEALAGQTSEYDRQIAIAKASGKSAVDLEIAKQQAIINTNKALIEQTLAYVRAGGEMDEAKNKLLAEQLEAIKGAVNQQKVIELGAQKESNEKYKTHLADKNKLLQEARDRDADVENAHIDAQEKREQLARENKRKADDDAEKAETARLEALGIAQDAQMKKFTADKNKQNEDALIKREADEKAATQGTIQLAQESLAATQQLTDLFFEYKRKGLQKGSAEEIKAAEKQFKVNKALQIANAVVTGIQGVMAAYSSGSAIPIIGAVAGPAFAILAGIAAAANIAKIAAAKFNPGTSSAPSMGGGGSAPASIPLPPTINTPGANTNQSTTFDESGKNLNAQKTMQPTINVTSTVSVEEINKKQNQVGVLEKQSTF